MKKGLLIVITICAAQFGICQFSMPKVVIEEFTGAWCGYCPEGQLIIDDIINTYGEEDVIPVAIHNGDAMTTSDGDAVDVAFNTIGYPSAVINRDGANYNRGVWKTNTATKLQGASSATVSLETVNYNPTNRLIEIVVKASFTGPLSGDLRFNAYIVENSILKTGSGYDQTNYFNTTAGHFFQGAGNPIVGFTHKHVLHAMLGGPFGSTAGIIPATVNFGSNYTESFTYTLPSALDPANITVVGMVMRYGATNSDRDIFNGDHAPLLTPVSVDESNLLASWMEVYPNPVSDISNVSYDLQQDGNIRMELLDASGKVVKVLADGFMNSGIHTETLRTAEMSSGIYLIRMSDSHGNAATKRLRVN